MTTFDEKSSVQQNKSSVVQWEIFSGGAKTA